ncbi:MULTISPECIES: alpha/beta fold hydrolase [Henriciella]|jgi:pimeloyl-ACP methyl ester carboxylesterase|uniref:Alpha/beta hydrolase n=1 Tax=Henriciella pelagia TaxID=1977912 RepID=A0ABQ1JRD4_9PROT|nr:alpha/beta hydrolase [Henriciella pelagia]GGB75647.1 alpha/beta hydrolase [Henriciella pelagia]
MLRKLAAILLSVVAILAAGWLALRRPDIPYDTLETAYSLPTSNFQTIDGVKIHFTDAGPRDAPVIVLLHGFAASVHTWSQWQSRLDDTYRVIAIDLPGHGLSRVPDDEPVSRDYYVRTVGAIADQLQLDSFALAGSSMGGGIAWKYAAENPTRLDALVLVDAAGWPMSSEDRETSPLVFKLIRIPFVRTLMKDLDLSSLIEDGLSDSFTDQTFVTPEMVDRYSSLSRAPGHRGALLELSAQGPDSPASVRDRLAGIDLPTLILWGEDDKLIPVSHARQFDEAIAKSVLIVYEGTGHLPQEERAKESASDVIAFLDQHVSALSPPFIEEDADEVDSAANGATPQTATGGGARPR